MDANVQYNEAKALAQRGAVSEARALYEELRGVESDARLRALVCNDLATLAAIEGDVASASRLFHDALASDPDCEAALRNVALLSDTDDATSQGPIHYHEAHELVRNESSERVKVAILSFLFNWPSTGGGIVHTVELARFLTEVGYEVRLIHPVYAPWGVGRVDATCPFPTERLEFDDSAWNSESIKTRFRRAVDAFAPDDVIVSDCWNFKPHLAAALQGYRFFLRMQALECLCPLNNLRLLPEAERDSQQCENNQLATPEACCRCILQRDHLSGFLHRAERALSGVGTAKYTDVLESSLKEAKAVLTLNPSIANLLRPYCRRVEVVTWGMDRKRFPWPLAEPDADSQQTNGSASLLFAGLVDEAIKGFPVIHEACARLWQRRKDFQLIVTSDPAGRLDEFTRRVGWQSQDRLPEVYRAADICVVPTIAQDGLSRTSVEAMASGIPVVASRIGGLPFTVTDGVTGLLCEAGNIQDWSEKIERLLDDGDLRRTMGLAGRREFETRFTWDVVINRSYRRLLTSASEDRVKQKR